MEAADVGEEGGREGAEGAGGATGARSGGEAVAVDTAVEETVDSEERGGRLQIEASRRVYVAFVECN